MASRRTTRAAWESYLDTAFPGYLLPSSMRRAIDLDAATRFVCRLGGPATDLDLLVQSHLLAGRTDALREFCDALADLARALPSRTHVEQRVWDGGFHGRLDAPRTIAHRLAGAPTRFVTRTRRRAFDLPENELARAVAARLHGVCEALSRADLLRAKHRDGTAHWGREALGAPAALRVLLDKSALRDIPDAPITPSHVRAARDARHPCYRLAVDWHHAMVDALDRPDPARLAEILAEGALRPSSRDTQFEIAALVKLIEALWTACERRAEGWAYERTVVASRRRSVARFDRPDGVRVEVFYNQAELPTGKARGARDRGVAHYLNSTGRLRPDITVLVQRAGEPRRGVVIETKHSDEIGYLSTGYGDALLYRHEYASELIDCPKAILVCSRDIKGAVSREHEVVAFDWRRWPPDEIVKAIPPPPMSRPEDTATPAGARS